MSSLATRGNLWLALLDAGVWAAWSASMGYLAHRVPSGWLARDRFLFRLRRLELDTRFYRRVLRMQRWKARLPEAGDLFRGGFSKRRLVRRDRDYLERFVVETRRAELTHWLILAFGPVFFAWNPWWLGLAMVAYAIVANTPCLLIQRYNRARLLRMLERLPAPRTA